MVEGRNVSENRMSTRRNGQKAVTEDGHNQGNYTPEYRYRLLKELLQIQKNIQEERPHVALITNQELIAIQVVWNRDMIFDFNVGNAYREVYNKEIRTNNIKSLDDTEKRILREICVEDMSYYHLIDNLITLQETKTLMLSKYGLHNDVENRIENFVKEIEQ